MRTATLRGSYLAVPDGEGPFPGVVVVHEAYGLNDNIKDVCRRLAGEGFVAMGVDLFEGRHRAEVYPGAKHSFVNDQSRNHDAGAAADSWQRVLAFFDEHVRQANRAPGPASTPD